MLKIGFRTIHVVGKYSTTKLYSQTRVCVCVYLPEFMCTMCMHVPVEVRKRSSDPL